MHIDLIAGARPNFMKIAPITHAIREAQKQGKDIHFRLIHTGQHYDKNMSDTFFEELNIPHPDVNLGAGGGTQAEQTAAIMIGYEKLLLEQGKPDYCLVVGDVTSTMACSITAQKLHVKVIHVEGGIRSGDWTMPEEINRLVTDAITNIFFTTSEVANENLRQAGVSEDKIVFVGNTMIDTLLANQDRLNPPAIWSEAGLQPKEYLVTTLHRPANVDTGEQLKTMLETIIQNTGDYKLVFPVHPRTRKKLDEIGYTHPRLIMVEPLGYLQFNYLVKHALGVITDSGGITEETTVMGVPCITLRDTTERPETVTIGTNELIGTNPEAIRPALAKLMSGTWKKGQIPPLWDGKTAGRIISYLLKTV
jgi:UDP-N-acetylglucosamine 2-epimerase (non-hydrolysing)